MHNFDDDFTSLLTAWNRHQDLRSAHAPISVLVDSSKTLEGARRLFH